MHAAFWVQNDQKNIYKRIKSIATVLVDGVIIPAISDPNRNGSLRLIPFSSHRLQAFYKHVGSGMALQFWKSDFTFNFREGNCQLHWVKICVEHVRNSWFSLIFIFRDCTDVTIHPPASNIWKNHPENKAIKKILHIYIEHWLQETPWHLPRVVILFLGQKDSRVSRPLEIVFLRRLTWLCKFPPPSLASYLTSHSVLVALAPPDHFLPLVLSSHAPSPPISTHLHPFLHFFSCYARVSSFFTRLFALFSC